MKPPSVASKKEQRRRFPLRMLRRKSSVTSLSMLDVDEMADSSTTGTDVVPASTMTQDSQRRRKCSVVGYNDMGQGAGLLFQGGERGTERAAFRGDVTYRNLQGQVLVEMEMDVLLLKAGGNPTREIYLGIFHLLKLVVPPKQVGLSQT